MQSCIDSDNPRPSSRWHILEWECGVEETSSCTDDGSNQISQIRLFAIKVRRRVKYMFTSDSSIDTMPVFGVMKDKGRKKNNENLKRKKRKKNQVKRTKGG